MINLRDILNGLVIGSGDWSDSLTSSKAYKISVIDDLIANDCPVCPTPCLTSCDSQYESITLAGFIPSLLLFTHLTNYHSHADAYLLQMCLHFSTPLILFLFFLHYANHTSSTTTYSIAILISPFSYFKDQMESMLTFQWYCYSPLL